MACYAGSIAWHATQCVGGMSAGAECDVSIIYSMGALCQVEEDWWPRIVPGATIPHAWHAKADSS